MQQAPQPVFTASPTAIQGPMPPPPPARRALPDRSVDNASIADAYVDFIFYCNPGVPPDTDASALRDAFRTPPRSGGKSFDTYALFELLKKLEAKELKTWAELALRLGVEPPDQEKGESSQKIQQYAVRLKRWMHSMHVDAFFDYLMGHQSPYWTEIPPEHIPVAELERDGVAAEDDMALRALLPQIKPRRGRRKPDDDEPGRSPSRRPSPQTDEFAQGGQPPTAEPWTAQPDGRASVFLFPPGPDPSRLNPSAAPWGNDMAQTPMSAYPMPQSAITPSTRNAFWADEPKSAITPSKPRTTRRHGAKVVSSAWRSGGIGASGKTRGRPPINRGANTEEPFSAFPASEGASFRLPSPAPDKSTPASKPAAAPASAPVESSPAVAQHSAAVPPVAQAPPARHPSHFSPIQESAHQRPAKRRMLSLQVPERKGGEVRLVTAQPPEPTAPPVVLVNGQTTDPRPDSQTAAKAAPASQPTNTLAQNPPPPPPPPPPSVSSAAPTQLPPLPVTAATAESAAAVTGGGTGTSTQAAAPPPPAVQGSVVFENPTDRTNMDGLDALFVTTVLSAEWYDANHKRIPPCGVDEAFAFAQAVVDTLRRSAPTKEAFLINLAGLAGGKILLHRGSLRITRLEELPDRTRYNTAWQLRYGSVVGEWSMEETVLHEKWKTKDKGQGKEGEKERERAALGAAPVNGAAAPAAAAAAATAAAAGDGDGGGGGSGGGALNSQAEFWRRKYEEMAATLMQRDEQMARLQYKILEAVKDST